MKPMSLPFVAGIIEREEGGERQLLVQTRFKPQQTSIYNGTFEFAAGVLDHPYESVYDALAREIKEETGLTLRRIIDDSRTEAFSPQITDAAFGFRPFCCLQQMKEGAPWVGFVFRCEVEPGNPAGQPGETRDVHWVSAIEFKKIVEQSPEKIFTLELPAWHYYFQEIAL